VGAHFGTESAVYYRNPHPKDPGGKTRIDEYIAVFLAMAGKSVRKLSGHIPLPKTFFMVQNP
jgi:hypothetical protein